MKPFWRFSSVAVAAFLLSGCHTLSNSAQANKQVSSADVSTPELVPQNNQMISEMIARKQNDELRELVKNRPDIPKKTFAGITPLFTAAFFNNKEAAQILIDAGADVNFTTSLGERPLDRAQSSNADAVADLLKQHGAKIGTMRR